MPSSDETAAAVPQEPAEHLESPSVSVSRVPDWLGVLSGLSGRPLREHAEVYQGLHADLQAALSEIDGA